MIRSPFVARSRGWTADPTPDLLLDAGVGEPAQRAALALPEGS